MYYICRDIQVPVQPPYSGKCAATRKDQGKVNQTFKEGIQGIDQWKELTSKNVKCSTYFKTYVTNNTKCILIMLISHLNRTTMKIY